MIKNISIFYTFFSLFIFITLFNFNISIIKLNVHRTHFEDRNNLQDILKSNLLTDIKIGTPPQNLKVNLEFFSTGLFIVDNDRNNSDNEYLSPNNIYYKRNESKTYIEIKETDYEKRNGINFDYVKRIKSQRAHDNIYLGDDFIIKNGGFFLAKTLTKTPFGSGFLGLDLNNRYLATWEFKGFLPQINFNNQNFLISFNKTNNDEGFLYFNLPINNNISVTEKDLKLLPQLNEEYLLKNYIEYNVEDYKWKIKIDEVRYSEDLVKKETVYLQFEVGTNIIGASQHYLEFIKESFFDKYNLLSDKICYFKKLPISKIRHYGIYICDDGVEKYFNNFPKLTFVFQNHKIEFDSKDLFQKCENLEDAFTAKRNYNQDQKRIQYVFLLFENTIDNFFDYREFWRLGTLFFKKVDMYFDVTRFKIGMIFDDNQKINKFSVFFENKKNIWAVGILILFYLICYLLLSKKLFRKKSSRKKGLLNTKDADKEENYENKELEDLPSN